LKVVEVVMELGILVVVVVAVASDFWDFPCRVWPLLCDYALDGFVLGRLQFWLCWIPGMEVLLSVSSGLGLGLHLGIRSGFWNKAPCIH
jgi:hypothetical protein